MRESGRLGWDLLEGERKDSCSNEGDVTSLGLTLDLGDANCL